jgi:hypothetical protein
VIGRRCLVALVVLLASSSALAQPRGGLTPQGGTVVGVDPTSGGGVTIGGTASRPSIGLITSCGATQTLQWSGSAWACAAGGGITNAAGNNVIPKSNGAGNLVASSLTDNGSTVSITESTSFVSDSTHTMAVAGASTSTTLGNQDVAFRISNTSATTNDYAALVFGGTSSVAMSSIEAKQVDTTNHYADMRFATRAADGYLSRLDIASSGLVTANFGFSSTAAANTLGNLTTAAVTPGSFSTIQNDYAGCGANATICRLNCTAGSCDFTGISGGADGRQLILENVGSGNIVLYHQNTNSTTPGDRFLMAGAAQTTMITGGHISIFYDGAQSRWMMDQQTTGANWIGMLTISGGDLSVIGNTSISGSGHLKTVGAGVGFSSCGSAPAPVCNSTTCNDISGTFTTGGSGVTTCTITFGTTYTNADDATCIVSPMGTATQPTYTTTATTIAMSTSAPSQKYHYICVGH